MSISPITGPTPPSLFPTAVTGTGKQDVWEDFSVTLARQLQESDRMQKEAKEMAQKALLGNAGVSIHEAQIAGAKAELNLRLLMQVRNKALEVYREIMSMPA
ncbi:MAG: flagellar hook-basal body complex protein FliE [Magnetococcales bacterium]|nr:flagellar hook-basal body complex protein FliE [Magnetococcales bacterium]